MLHQGGKQYMDWTVCILLDNVLMHSANSPQCSSTFDQFFLSLAYAYL